MSGSKGFLVFCLAASLHAASFSGASALEFTQRAVAFGPRTAGTEANHKLQAYILDQLRKAGAQVTEDAFVARTPQGEVAMKNIIGKFPGSSGKAIAVTGHFDTKYLPSGRFVGASDGGSSTGVLLELARISAGAARTDDLYLAFFDGEEAFGTWGPADSLYGSRHLAELWNRNGNLARLKALINVDMVGDKNLNISLEGNSDPYVQRLVWKAAADLGRIGNFMTDSQEIEDDHIPFVRLGVRAIDLIDFDYPAWHTEDDTMDKLSAQSLETVGAVVTESVRRLEKLPFGER